jgi:hypothetical protein
MSEEEAIRDFLGDRPGHSELVEWRSTLEARLATLEQDCAAAGSSPSPAMTRQLNQLRRQIAALRQEEAITEFVEDSVRVTLAMGAIVEEVGDPDD